VIKLLPRVLAALLASLLLLATSRSAPAPKAGERERALHVLNRLGFGPRPGDVDRVLATGIDAWIEQQLHPERIADRAVEVRLQAFPTLRMSDREIWQTYYAPLLEARREQKRLASMQTEKDAGDETQEGAVRKLRAKIPPAQRPVRLIEELSAQRVIRAAESERQLDEVMVDFWFNHFNVFSGKGVDRVFLTGYERDVIRPHVWGHFEELLLATAKSPAMLFYLDNARSVAEAANRPQRPNFRAGAVRRNRGFSDGAMRPDRTPEAQQRARGGLNENYAREIMELHTLGVDGGYSQKDVTELARVFTGWTIARPEEGGGFVFRSRLHDSRAKTVLGIHFAAGGGIEEGEKMIRMLAHHPATARHIATQLCQRLVADDPPKALVDRVAKRFLDTDGDLRQTVKAVVESPEFRDPHYFEGKVKSPFEYVVSAVRAVDASIDNPLALVRQIAQIGEPLYGAQPPTGYSDAGSAWMNSGALLSRLNFSLSMAAGKVPGVHVDVAKLIPAGEGDSVKALANALTGRSLSETSMRVVRERIAADGNAEFPTIAGLILGSPEFQKQ
jgi:uncharacterized protein (DUF1800 family)